MFPIAYQETMEAGKAGKLGREVRQFLEEHPDGALDCGIVILQCSECGELGSAPDLSMYIPGEDSPPPSSGNWSVACPHEGSSCIAPWDLEKYTLVGLYNHRCGKCKGRMKIIREKEFEQLIHGVDSDNHPTKIPCPKCKEPLWLEEMLMWD
jgi:hypothetical protein